MPRKTADVNELDNEALREIARAFGRAFCQTIVVAHIPKGHKVEAAAIAMDEHWTKVADKIIKFAKED